MVGCKAPAAAAHSHGLNILQNGCNTVTRGRFYQGPRIGAGDNVRQLERNIGSVARKVALKVAQGKGDVFTVKIEELEDYLGHEMFFHEMARQELPPGVATGLAVTEMGGEVLFVVNIPPGFTRDVDTGQHPSILMDADATDPTAIAQASAAVNALNGTAFQRDLPVALHVRRSQDHILKHLRRIKVRGGFAHAFNGSAQQAAEFVKLGFCLGFGGTATFPQAQRVRALLREVPIANVVVETDAPDIPPSFLGTMASNARNSPAYLPRIGALLAEVRGMSTDSFAAATSANVRRVLALG